MATTHLHALANGDVRGAPAPARDVVVWKLQVANPRYASVRYRCLMPLMGLARRGVPSVVLEGRDGLTDFERVRAIVFVKSFTENDLTLARGAVAAGVPIYIDLCDNILTEEYGGDQGEAIRFRFAEMSRLSTGIVTTGPELARVLREQIPSAVPIHIVVDQIEEYETTKALIEDRAWHADPFGIVLRRGVKPTLRQRLRNVWNRWRWTLKKVPNGRRALLRSLTSPYANMRGARKALGDLLHRMRSISPRSLIAGMGRYGKRWSARMFRRFLSLLGTISRRIHWLLPHALRDTYVGRILRQPSVFVAGVKNRVSRSLRRVLAALAPTAAVAQGSIGELPASAGPARKTVVWFGHHGSNHGRYGLLALEDIVPDLVRVNERVPLRLLVISDNLPKFQRLFGNLPFPAEFRAWGPLSVFADIRSGDVCVVPNTRDEFSITKSANRVVMALSLGVPVVATSVPATEGLEGCIVHDRWEDGVCEYLRNPALVADHLAKARPIIAQGFSMASVARDWEAILAASRGQESPGTAVVA